MPAPLLTGGLSDPVLDAQSTFRAVMAAMARPGTMSTIPSPAGPPSPMGGGMGAIACTLIDADTPLWLDPPLRNEAVTGWLAFHTGARIVPLHGAARFALVADAGPMPPLETFAQGTQDYPDRSATIVVELPALSGGRLLTLHGPGIPGETSIGPVGLPDDFVQQWRSNAGRFPCGVDLVLVAGDAVLCLPRTARLMPADA